MYAQRGRPVTKVVAHYHQLFAPIQAADSRGGQVGGTHTVYFYAHLVHGLVGQLGAGLQDLADDLVAVGHADRKAVAGFGHGFQQGAVGAIAHDRCEQAHVMLLQEFQKGFLFGDADIGDAIGDQHDAGGAVGIQRRKGALEPGVQVGAAAGLQVLHFPDVGLHLLGGGGYIGLADVTGAITEADDPEAVVRAHPAQRLTHAVGQTGQLAAHRPGGVEHEDPVAAIADRLQIGSGCDREHEAAALRADRLVGHRINTARQVAGVAPIDREVLIQARRRAGVQSLLRRCG